MPAAVVDVLSLRPMFCILLRLLAVQTTTTTTTSAPSTVTKVSGEMKFTAEGLDTAKVEAAAKKALATVLGVAESDLTVTATSEASASSGRRLAAMDWTVQYQAEVEGSQKAALETKVTALEAGAGGSAELETALAAAVKAEAGSDVVITGLTFTGTVTEEEKDTETDASSSPLVGVGVAIAVILRGLA